MCYSLRPVMEIPLVCPFCDKIGCAWEDDVFVCHHCDTRLSKPVFIAALKNDIEHLRALAVAIEGEFRPRHEVARSEE